MATRRTAARRSGGGGAGQAVTVVVIVALLAGLAWFGYDRMNRFKQASVQVPPTGPRVTLQDWCGRHGLTGTIPDPLPDPWRLSLETAWRYRPVGAAEQPGAWVEIQFEGGRFTGVQIAMYRGADRAGPFDLLDEAEFSGQAGPELRRLVAELAAKGAKASVDGPAGDFELFGWREEEGGGLRRSLVCAVRRGAPEASRMIAKARADWAAGSAGGTVTGTARTGFDVVLVEVGRNRDAVLAAVCEIASVGPEAGATLVDSAPKVVRLGAPREEAEAIRRKLEAAGAKAEVR